MTAPAVVSLIVALATLGAAAPARAQSRVSFSRDIAPILFEKCAACHRPGEIGPFSLLTYEDARPRARPLAGAPGSHAMPPWKPEPGFGAFTGSPQLTDRQITV